jgi:hypothetical protein
MSTDFPLDIDKSNQKNGNRRTNTQTGNKHRQVHGANQEKRPENISQKRKQIRKRSFFAIGNKQVAHFLSKIHHHNRNSRQQSGKQKSSSYGDSFPLHRKACKNGNLHHKQYAIRWQEQWLKNNRDNFIQYFHFTLFWFD